MCVCVNGFMSSWVYVLMSKCVYGYMRLCVYLFQYKDNLEFIDVIILLISL
jgi:hypothetical protein